MGNGVKDLIQKSVPSDCVGDKFDKVLDFFKKHYLQKQISRLAFHRMEKAPRFLSIDVAEKVGILISYSSIEEWYDGELDKLNAWKIVEGNLVYDENKYNILDEFINTNIFKIFKFCR